MVSQHPQQPDAMRMRLRPKASAAPPGVFAPDVLASSFLPAAPPPWNITIPAADGTPLLVMREENGLLVVEGDESRWTEAAKRFVHGMMQWAGQAGINWKDEARKAAEGT
jgi:hypothetical protein